eukprot:5235347-Amphidinium_carterae.1
MAVQSCWGGPGGISFGSHPSSQQQMHGRCTSISSHLMTTSSGQRRAHARLGQRAPSTGHCHPASTLQLPIDCCKPCGHQMLAVLQLLAVGVGQGRPRSGSPKSA